MRIAAAPLGAQREAVEWPTVLLAAAVYAGWAALTYFQSRIPVWLLVPIGAALVAWHSSLQHEVLHGHPTRWRAVNRLIGLPPLSLWLSYDRYAELHLRHHRDVYLTDPIEDPESRYVEPARWQAMAVPMRALLRAQKTLLGRLLIGPAWIATHYLSAELRAAIAGDTALRRDLLAHLGGAVLVALWLKLACDMSLWFYLLAIVYPGTALLLVRSFGEHRAAEDVRRRTAIVENSRIFGPLFLFNNLHSAHHERPSLPWYKLPGWYRANRARLVAANGGLVYDGYGELFRRYLLTPRDPVAHPLGRAAAAPPAAEPTLAAL